MDNIDWKSLSSRLVQEMAVAVPCLDPKERKLLLRQAQDHTFTPAALLQGSRQVEQHFSATKPLPRDGPFGELALHIEENILTGAKRYPGMFLRHPAFSLNHMVLQRYEPCEIGIGPHRDYKRHPYLVIIVVLSGKGEFSIMSHEDGSDRRVVNAKPGHAILMRMPGFYGTLERPLHDIRNITKPRVTLILRQVP